jgi:hypothetical protein
MTTPSPCDRHRFDLHGYLLLPGMLAAGECDRLRECVHNLEGQRFDDGWMVQADRRRAQPAPTREGQLPRLRLNGLLRLHPDFHALIDHQGLVPYLEDFMDTPQLVNTWSISKGQGAQSSNWHRGLPAEHYCVRQGRIRTAMLNVVWFLDDNGPEDGCMVVVPGSHKNAIDLDWQSIPHGSMPGMARVVGKRGDVLLMSECVLHDGVPKTTPGTRTNLYFNYAASYFNVMTYSPEHNRHFCMPADVRSRFTPRQQALTAWMDYARAVESPG